MIDAVTLALAVGLAQPDGAAAASPPSVDVYVTATDLRGRVVDDLHQDDFIVQEEGVARPIREVRFVRAAPAPAPGEMIVPIVSADDERAEAARDGTRLVGVFLDEYHVAPDNAPLVREALLTFVDQYLGPRDLVVLVKPLDSLLRIRATRDRDWVRAQIAGFEGRKGALDPRNSFEENFIASGAAQVEAVRAQISTAALHAMIRHLADLPGGRKAIVIASEGFDRAPRRRGDTLPTVIELVRLAHRGGVMLHALDPSTGDPVSSARREAMSEPPGRVVLRTLAAGTEGFTLFGPEGWRDGIASVAFELSHYYVVKFEPGTAEDGERRTLEIAVRRPTVRLRAPSGYWTESPLERLRLALHERPAPSAPSPSGLRPMPRTSGLIRPWFGITRWSEGFARISFVWEAVGKTPGARRRSGDPARVSMRVMTVEGTPVFEGVVTPVNGGPRETSLALFDAPAGRLRIEMAIEDATNHRLDSDVRDVLVQEPRGDPSLGTMAFLRARTAREIRELRHDPQALPTASRVFSRAEQLLVRVPVYADGGQPDVSATVVSRAGRAMRRLTVAPAPVAGQRQIDLPLAGLPAGEYRLEITAARDGRSVSEGVDFRVVP